MDKEKFENPQLLYTKSQLKRMNVINDYLTVFKDLILEKKISPNRALVSLADKYELSRAGVRLMLENAGIYKGKENPCHVPTEEEMASKPTYFF